jgi:tetratricopeptide (TPR) repeat protein
MTDATELLRQADKYYSEGQYEEAEKIYICLLSQNHFHADLLACLGSLYLKIPDKMGLAIVLLQLSIDKAVKRRSDVLGNLGLAYKFVGQPQKALHYMEESTKTDDAAPESLTSYGAMLPTDEAIKFHEKALIKNSKLAIAHWNLSQSLLEGGQWERGWQEFEWGLKCVNQRQEKDYGLPTWDGTPGKTIVVYGEQGLGDEIMFASMLPELIDSNNVVLDCHPRLKTLFENAFDIPCHGTRKDKEINWLNNYKIDSKIAIGSLGKFFRNSKEAFPGTSYLKAEPLLPKADKLRVGISWTGGLKSAAVIKRTVPLSWWIDILKNDCEFISLQYTDCSDEIDIVRRQGYPIEEFDEIKSPDYQETADLVKSCDLVISVCTSVIHLAGALGVPCWVMTPANPAWRYQNSGRMPWYRSVKLFRQPSPEVGAWIPVIQLVARELEELVCKQSTILLPTRQRLILQPGL